MTPVLMFHHFWGPGHRRGQGALSADEFRGILDRQPGLLPASEWLERARAKTLAEHDTCVSFDDGLKCQVDVALAVLEERGLDAFWFVQTAPQSGVADKIETFRYVRTNFFDDVDQFYRHFFEVVDRDYPDSGLEGVDFLSYLAEFSFYTPADRKFRYIRDNRPEICDAVMAELMRELGVEEDSLLEKLWVSADDLRFLAARGHVIGLHSHSHPYFMSHLSYEEQLEEYTENYRLLCQLAGLESITTMAHPRNSYNQDTLRVLESLDIEVGFRSNAALAGGSMLELPRMDHALLVGKP